MKVALVGYSGHALVCADTLQLQGDVLAGYFDVEQKQQNFFNLPFLGSETEFIKEQYPEIEAFFPSIGNNETRKKVFNTLFSKYLKAATAIHPNASVSSYSNIEEGVLVCAKAVINAFSKIGKGSIINTVSVVEHDCVVGEFVHLAPGSILCGNVCVGNGSFIGAGTVVKEGVTIGQNAIIGAGSVVLTDIPNNEVWFGNPAKKRV
jgi:sugar O-acyltransferase (sialic acid O-acetyltransferase NeuD family)